MNADHKQMFSFLIQFLQLVVLVIAVAGLFLTVGRKDATLLNNVNEISDLRSISSDLVKASIESTTTNREQDRRLTELRSRIDRPEIGR
jgi:hypothetical protein